MLLFIFVDNELPLFSMKYVGQLDGVKLFDKEQAVTCVLVNILTPNLP